MQRITDRVPLAAAFVVVLFIAACNTLPEEPGAPDSESTEALSFAGVCDGQPDGATPPGCDQIHNCSVENCLGGACVSQVLVDSPCTTSGGGVCHFGVCNSSGACVQDPNNCGATSCKQTCENEFNACSFSCGGEESCVCTCKNLKRSCLFGCGVAGVPEVCVVF